MIIDAHAHIYPDKISQQAADYIAEFYKIPVQANGRVDMLLAAGERAGIDRFVVHSAAQAPRQVQSINNFIAAECQQHPNFIGLGTLHKDMEDPKAEIERVLALGLHGIKLHPDMQLFDMDDPGMDNIYAMLQEKHLPVLMHCGDYRYNYSHPRRLANLLDKFPGLTVVAAHFGGWSVFDLAVEHLEQRHCYLDVSSSIPYLGNRRTKELIDIYGPGRILFGSDFPMWDPEASLRRIMELDLSDTARQQILCDNALKVFGSAVPI